MSSRALRPQCSCREPDSALRGRRQSPEQPRDGIELETVFEIGGRPAARVVTIAIAALALGGLLERAGVLAVSRTIIGDSPQRREPDGRRLVSVSMNILAAEQYMSIVVPGMTLGDLYDEQWLESP